ncbi:MAG: V-type ATPase subunit [Clostridia bacterium]|nr:V-type ATPase subunit [Clostridia bacterium]
MGIRKSKETDYLYASARVRAAENRLIGADKMEAAIAARDASEIEGLIESIDVRNKSEDKLSAYLADAYSFIAEISPDNGIASFLRYGYDCNNIKAALKCHFRETDSSEMLFSFGTVSDERILKMPVSQDFSALPKHMSEAAAEAFDAYAKTGDPQLIDIILDKACFADMLEAAKESGEAFAAELVRMKIDLVNIMMCVRILRMGGGASEKDVLRRSLISGGYIDEEKLFDEAQTEPGIASFLSGTEYSSLSEFFTEDGRISLAEIERRCDDLYMKKVKNTKVLPFGAPILCAYLVAAEYEVKNLRIILAGKRAGLSPERLRERVRVGYV